MIDEYYANVLKKRIDTASIDINQIGKDFNKYHSYSIIVLNYCIYKSYLYIIC